MAKFRGKLVRKRPTVKTLNHKKLKNVLYVKSKTPYVSALKRINKWLERLQTQKQSSDKYITLLGMGKAIEKTLSIACHFQEIKKCKVGIKTISTEVVDEIAEDDEEDDEGIKDEDRENKLQIRKLSGVEIKIHPY
ncbi:ribonuclease P/MRP protein subunit POP7 Ecym_7087 [Eremothecium cymbalariae DBVPG|uniref:Uncharacterized protein n=1 Tax=Eremothecium cymbalariae (strain CBS 270.75 / DBVPG 7215 / KCTC 17166 / NRRL Y-17582) TaxID=931890 RepID=G8JVS4_ERECY|nr:hypothetical protein Ecym_7087 [Eremothecium cymbalariae DBVPG\